MEWVEVTANNVDAAKDLALDRLGVDESDAEFEILEEPRPGLFGRIRGEARVRARVRPTAARPKAERRDRRRGRADKADTKTDTSESTDAADAPISSDRPERAERSSRSAGEQRGRTSQRSARRTADDADTGKDGDMSSSSSNELPPATDPTVVAAAATTFLEGLLDAFGTTAATTAEIVDGDVDVQVDGDDLGLLIGPQGATLQAVQELTRLATQKSSSDRGVRLRIDIAGYRERRREALVRFTAQVAEQVIATGAPRALEPMNSADRKVVHDAAQALGGVVTLSEGEEPRRRVVIKPAP